MKKDLKSDFTLAECLFPYQTDSARVGFNSLRETQK